ncbi:zinc finger BED domain-containing protein DAYSLEEPER-like [Vigna angularis]|uniref:zinc finger BED domain-containing protein DAYSLEEPER-like n=1 Tax=Phaseolus angularis TaxID=3914 RepID=UPI0022B2E127|nr:zinc finger BED domain-containing protein DAYSLEEPER-like [Vigna angularis]
MDHFKSNPLTLVDDLASETPGPSESATTNKKEVSNIWNFFTKIGKDEDGIEKAACKYCGNNYKVGKHPVTKNNYGTSHLSRHVNACRSIANLDVDMNLYQEGKFGTRKINQKIHRKLLARAIIKHSLPYNFVEYEGIREWIKYINPNVDMKCRNTTVSDVEKEYIEQKDKVKQIMSKIPNRICLTSDVWTAVTSEGYICLTAHFVDENWKLTKKTKKVLEKFKRLFKEYVKNFSIPGVSLSQSPTESILMSQSNTEGKKFKRSRIISDFKMYKIYCWKERDRCLFR